jgi:hypothetical protein
VALLEAQQKEELARIEEQMDAEILEKKNLVK